MTTDPFEVEFLQIPFISQHFTSVFKDSSVLLPAELIIVKNASTKRRSDFSTGRYCARQALVRLKNISPDIMQGKGKEPIWPNGIVGSISHSQKIAGAVVALQHDVYTIGLDIETIGGIGPEMWELIFHHSEQSLIRSRSDQALWATLLFSLKESFYKLQYPLTRQFLDFKDIIISEIGDRLFFSSVKPQFDLNSFGLVNIETLWLTMDNQLVTLCYVPAQNQHS